MSRVLPRLATGAPALLMLLLAIPAGAAAPAAGAAKIVRKPIQVKYHTFDPQNRPAQMPTLHPGEAAVCVSKFGAGVELRYTTTTRRQGGGPQLSRLTVDDVRLELTLEVDVWLPENASDKLKAHEEGHRQIAERIYDEVAERAARAAAGKVAGRKFEGEGATAKESQEAAASGVGTLQSEIIEAYLEQTNRAGQKVQEAYDEITAHGTKLHVAEADAIRQAWERHTPPLWTPKMAAAAAGGPARAATRPAAAASAARPATRPAAR